jgi:hypothetical protein
VTVRESNSLRPLDPDEVAERLEREISFLRIVMPVLDGARVISEDEALRTARALLRGMLTRLEELHNELGRWISEPEPRPKARDED